MPWALLVLSVTNFFPFFFTLLKVVLECRYFKKSNLKHIYIYTLSLSLYIYIYIYIDIYIYIKSMIIGKTKCSDSFFLYLQSVHAKCAHIAYACFIRETGKGLLNQNRKYHSIHNSPRIRCLKKLKYRYVKVKR